MNQLRGRWVPMLASLFAALVPVGAAAPLVNADDVFGPFAARFTGIFGVTGGVGQSVLFVVGESGTGEEETLGAFAYSTSLFHNEARIPPGCGPFSSTGVGGSGVLTFADGTMTTRRTSGAACFAFPTITVAERWVIAGGTGAYVGTTGDLTRQLQGNVLTGAAAGTITGTLKLP